MASPHQLNIPVRLQMLFLIEEVATGRTSKYDAVDWEDAETAIDGSGWRVLGEFIEEGETPTRTEQ